MHFLMEHRVRIQLQFRHRPHEAGSRMEWISYILTGLLVKHLAAPGCRAPAAIDQRLCVREESRQLPACQYGRPRNDSCTSMTSNAVLQVAFFIVVSG